MNYDPDNARHREIGDGFTRLGTNVVTCCSEGQEEPHQAGDDCMCSDFDAINECHVCDTRLAGRRHTLAIIRPGKGPIDYLCACDDCLMVCANGEFPE